MSTRGLAGVVEEEAVDLRLMSSETLHPGGKSKIVLVPWDIAKQPS